MNLPTLYVLLDSALNRLHKAKIEGMPSSAEACVDESMTFIRAALQEVDTEILKEKARKEMENEQSNDN
jgi:hypothetical protein